MEPNFTNETPTNVHQLYSDTHPRAIGQAADWKVMVDTISNDLSTLWDRERLLVRTEINEKIMEVKEASTTMAIGAGLCFAGVIASVLAVVYVLDVFLPLWASAVIATVGFFLIGGILFGMAKRKLSADRLRPRHSIETLSEFKTTLKERVHEFKH